MIMQNNFKNLESHTEIREAILELVSGLDLNVSRVRDKGWIYATFEDSQILEHDADNLSKALESINVLTMYGFWIYNVENEVDFEVYPIASDRKSIEDSQDLGLCLLDADDSYIVNEGELKFLIIRPCQNRWPIPYTTVIAGLPDFIDTACSAKGWIINDWRLITHTELRL